MREKVYNISQFLLRQFGGSYELQHLAIRETKHRKETVSENIINSNSYLRTMKKITAILEILFKFLSWIGAHELSS